MMSGKVKVVELSHGGSGPWGNSAWAARVNGCLEQLRLQSERPIPCEQVYRPSKTGPNAMLVGSMVHAYIEHELKHGQAVLPSKDEDPITFIDSECEWDPPADAAKEAHRVYWGWVKARQNWGEGKTEGAEILLDADINGVRIQAKVDHLVVDPDGVLTLEDFKTSARSEDVYSTGRGRLQMQLYTMAAWHLGYDVQRIRIRQIVKTKEVKENIYQGIDLPTPMREDWILRCLRGGLAREAAGPQGPWGSGCDWCYYGRNLICKL